MTSESLLQAVQEVARRAGGIALRFFRTGLDVEAKSDGSPVTQADREAELEARRWIEKRFPADGILGEEGGLTRGDARRRWLIDPIDGTKSFVRGVPLYGTLIAVVEQEHVLAGCAFFPSTDEIIAAAPGCGCWWNGTRAQVSRIASMRAATVLTTKDRFQEDAVQRAAWDRLAAASSISRTWGDCYGYLLVACGRAEVMTDGVMNPWDAAALMPIIEEAGGVFTDWNGRRTAFGGSVIATNAALANEARALLSPTRQTASRMTNA